MHSTHPLSPARRLTSFRHALRGIVSLLRSEPNAQLHALATLGVATAGWLCALSRFEWCFVVLACALVWITEALNTALERVCDRISLEFHPLVGVAKDVAAAAVLIAALGAAIVGVLIFGPRVVAWAA